MVIALCTKTQTLKTKQSSSWKACGILKPTNSLLKYEQRLVPGTSRERFIRQCLLPMIYMCLCFRVNMPQQGGNKYVLHQLFKAFYIPSVLQHFSSWAMSALPSENASKYLQIGQENMLWNEYKLGMAAIILCSPDSSKNWVYWLNMFKNRASLAGYL